MSERPSHAIRRATAADADVLGSMRAAQQIEIGGALSPEATAAYERMCRDFFARELAGPASWLFGWIAEAGGFAAGGSVLTLAPGMPRIGGGFAGPDGRIRNVYVRPDFRARGLGRELTVAAIEAAEALGVSRLTLGASPMGRRIYGSLGFITKGDEMVYEP